MRRSRTPSTRAERGNSSTVTASLNRASSEAVTLTVAASAGTNAGAGDFALSNAKTLTIAAGQTASTGVVTVTAKDNTVDAPDKSVTVSATALRWRRGGPGEQDADDRGRRRCAGCDAGAGGYGHRRGRRHDDGDRDALSHPSSAATTVTVTGVSDFYTVGSDATVVIAAGQTANATATATVAAVDDDVDNIGNRSVTVTGTASNDQGVGAVTGPSLTLTDDEATPTATLALSSSSISESGRRCERDGELEPGVERGGDADGGGFGERLHAVEREDADHRVGGRRRAPAR